MNRSPVVFTLSHMKASTTGNRAHAHHVKTPTKGFSVRGGKGVSVDLLKSHQAQIRALPRKTGATLMPNVISIMT